MPGYKRGRVTPTPGTPVKRGRYTPPKPEVTTQRGQPPRTPKKPGRVGISLAAREAGRKLQPTKFTLTKLVGKRK